MRCKMPHVGVVTVVSEKNYTAKSLVHKMYFDDIQSDWKLFTIELRIVCGGFCFVFAMPEHHSSPTHAVMRNMGLIAELKRQIPEVDRIFIVHRRIGEGTFSSVFLASLKSHEHKPMNKKRLFAVKHLIPTSHPRRIAQELRCMKEIGGKDNVVGVELCLRKDDAIAFVMPFISHIRFVDFFDKMDARELQEYMSNLLIALRHVHSFNVIHRDVKPSNFLYDRRKRKYLLVDFGLAQSLNKSIDSTKSMASTSAVDNTNNAQQQEAEQSAVCDKAIEQDKTIDVSEAISSEEAKVSAHNDNENEVKAKRRASHSNDTENQCSLNELNPAKRHCGPVGSQMIANPINQRPLYQQQSSAPTSNIPSQFKSPLTQVNTTISSQKNATHTPITASLLADVKSAVLSYSMHKQIENLRKNPQQTSTPTSNNSTPKSKAHQYNVDNRLSGKNARCLCHGRPSVCNICLIKPELHATRAGTPGYRPCEVLIKYPDQTTAVDIWAAGVILISILSGCYPFFQGTNDFNALAEIITVFGVGAVKRVATDLGRQVCSNSNKKALHLRKLCMRLRNRGRYQQQNNTLNNDDKNVESSTNLQQKCDNCEQIEANCLCQHTTYNADFSDDIYPDSVYELLEKLLAIHPNERVSANAALDHQFFQENFE